MTQSSQDPLSHRQFRPGWIIFLAILGGIAAAGVGTAMVLWQSGRRARGAWVAALSCFLGCAFIATLIWWSAEWYVVTLVMVGCHLIAGVVLYLLCARTRPEVPVLSTSRARPGLAGEMVGAAGGLLGILLVGPGVIATYLLLLDRLFSSYVPIAFDNSEALGLFFGTGAICALGAAAGGALFVRSRQSVTIGQAAWMLGAFLWSFFALSFFCQAFVGVPSFQAAPASGKNFGSVSAIIILVELLLGSWWSIFLAFYICDPSSIGRRISRGACVVALHACTALVVCVTLGVPGDMFLFAGKEFERHAHIGAALACYERGLAKQPNEHTASWMQYRVALLNHKRGDEFKALDGFRRVVAKYNANPDLVKQADYFVKRLKELPEPRRTVRPGGRSGSGSSGEPVRSVHGRRTARCRRRRRRPRACCEVLDFRDSASDTHAAVEDELPHLVVQRAHAGRWDVWRYEDGGKTYSYATTIDRFRFLLWPAHRTLPMQALPMKI
jgi:hypothetical protein